MRKTKKASPEAEKRRAGRAVARMLREETTKNVAAALHLFPDIAQAGADYHVVLGFCKQISAALPKSVEHFRAVGLSIAGLPKTSGSLNGALLLVILPPDAPTETIQLLTRAGFRCDHRYADRLEYRGSGNPTDISAIVSSCGGKFCEVPTVERSLTDDHVSPKPVMIQQEHTGSTEKLTDKTKLETSAPEAATSAPLKSLDSSNDENASEVAIEFASTVPTSSPTKTDQPPPPTPPKAPALPDRAWSLHPKPIAPLKPPPGG